MIDSSIKTTLAGTAMQSVCRSVASEWADDVFSRSLRTDIRCVKNPAKTSVLNTFSAQARATSEGSFQGTTQSPLGSLPLRFAIATKGEWAAFFSFLAWCRFRPNASSSKSPNRSRLGNTCAPSFFEHSPNGLSLFPTPYGCLLPLRMGTGAIKQLVLGGVL